jgi:hypothetical protein
MLLYLSRFLLQLPHIYRLSVAASGRSSITSGKPHRTDALGHELAFRSNARSTETGCYPVAILDQFSVEGHLEKPQYFRGFVVRAEGFEPPTF